MTTDRPSIHVGIVGAGPRGVVALERLCVNAPILAPGIPVTIHVVDPYPAGAGRVWQRDQNRLLLMNTVASDVTVFTDKTVPCEGPIVPGPTQYQWARAVAAGEHDGVDPASAAEAARMMPWSYASRAFQGVYMSWALNYIIRKAPPEITVIVHRARAVALDDVADGRQEMRLEGVSDPILLDAVVLAVGHFDVAPTAEQAELQRFAADHGLAYAPPASPAEVDLTPFSPGEPVVLRGLGLNFFDYVTLLTQGRGGRFVGDDDDLKYEPSGREPLIYAGSGRGVPYFARAEVHLEVVPRYQPRFLTADVISRLRVAAGRGETDFMSDLWPYIGKEVGFVYYRSMLRDADDDVRERFLERYSGLKWDSPEMAALIESHFPDPATRWSWEMVDRPYTGRRYRDRDEYQDWVAARLDWDLEQSAVGPARSAFKATAAIMRDLRDEIRQVISHQGIRGGSYRDHVDRWFSGLNNYVASGPPVVRIRELRALLAAGTVRMVGPRMRIEPDGSSGRFVVWSPEVDGEPLSATGVIEAHLPLTDVRRTTDPLLRHLLENGACRPHTIPDTTGPDYETGGLDVTERDFRLVDADGRPHRGRFSYGPPVESVQWVTAIGARPHVGSRTLLQGDAIARGCLRTGAENLRRLESAITSSARQNPEMTRS